MAKKKTNCQSLVKNCENIFVFRNKQTIDTTSKFKIVIWVKRDWSFTKNQLYHRGKKIWLYLSLFSKNWRENEKVFYASVRSFRPKELEFVESYICTISVKLFKPFEDFSYKINRTRGKSENLIKTRHALLYPFSLPPWPWELNAHLANFYT